MRTRPGLAALAAALTLLAAAACGGAEPEPPANVLLIVVDTLRRDRLPVYGYRARDTAPALAAFAAREGAIVEDGVVGCSSWTKPSVATLFTGLPPAQHGVMRLVGPGSRLQDPHTLAAEFARAGYATACVMSNHLLTRAYGSGMDDGFQHWDERPARHVHAGTSAAEVADSALAWLAERDDAHPWFLVAHFFDPHAVLVDHPGRDWFAPGYGGWVRGGDDTERLREMQERCTAADREQLGALYDEEVRAVDDAFARLLAALDARADGARTLVVFTSDHGEELAERGLIGHTRTLHAELNDLPLVVRPARGARGAWSLPRPPGGGVAQQQIYAAILRGAGLPVPAGRDGVPAYQAAEVDFVPVKREHAEKFAHKRAVVAGPYKLIHDLQDGSWRLHDRAADPGEFAPLPEDHPERARLQSLLAGHPWWESP
jgi:arylsulfatase A-like enzyme